MSWKFLIFSQLLLLQIEPIKPIYIEIIQNNELLLNNFYLNESNIELKTFKNNLFI